MKLDVAPSILEQTFPKEYQRPYLAMCRHQDQTKLYGSLGSISAGCREKLGSPKRT